jgi:DNA-binding response OmpR family regulator
MPAFATAKVLAVEDDPIVRADLRLILEDAGFEVHEVRDGYEALEATRSSGHDVILLDLGLPRLGGVETTRRILEERDVPIVALTGRGETAIAEAVEAGACAYIRKPFDEGTVVGTVRAVLEERVEPVDPALEHAHLLVMIEQMCRDGYSHSEITSALDRVHRESRRFRARETLRRWLSRDAAS